MAAASTQPNRIYLDEKWKLSKKESFPRNRFSSAAFCSSSSSSQTKCSFTRKCVALVKEQRARFYIIRRCVTMLLCWREYSES